MPESSLGLILFFAFLLNYGRLFELALFFKTIWSIFSWLCMLLVPVQSTVCNSRRCYVSSGTSIHLIHLHTKYLDSYTSSCSLLLYLDVLLLICMYDLHCVPKKYKPLDV